MTLAPLKVFALDAQTGPFGSQLHAAEYIVGGVPVINPSNIKDGVLVADNQVTVTQETAKRLSMHRLQAGDLVFARRGELGRSAVVSDHSEGWLCGTGSLRVRVDPATLYPRYAGYALQSAEVRSYFTRLAVGSTMANLNTSIVLNAPVPNLPQQMQRRIVDFLDVETSRMDRLANSQLRLTRLLKKREETAIDQTLRDAALRMIRLKHLLKAPPSYGANEAAEHRRQDWPRYIRTTDIAEDGGLREETFASLPPEAARPYLLDDGDLLFVRSGATAGKSFLYESQFGTAAHAGYLIRARVDHKVALPRLVWYFSRTPTYWQQISEGTTQATIQNVNAEKYGNLLVPYVEPSRQASTLRELDSLTEWSFKVKQRAHRLLDLLAERRRALITAAVTGQFDVSTASGRNVTEGVTV